MRNVRTEISSFPASDAVSRPSSGERVRPCPSGALTGLGDGRQLGSLPRGSSPRAVWPPFVSKGFDTPWQTAAADPQPEVSVRKLLMIRGFSGKRQCYTLDPTDCFYAGCVCKTGRATFVLTEREARSVSCSSQVGRTCCQWLCRSTSTCCGSNQ